MYDLMTSTWGLGPWLFRAPYDRFDRFIEAGLNLPMISYDVDGKDGAGRSPAQVLRTVQEQAHDGAIIRLHDSSDNAAETVDLIAEWLHENGYLYNADQGCALA